MKYVFIDTNILLNFYAFHKDHIDKLEKIINLMKEKKIILILPQQTVDEFNRRREDKFKETLEHIDSFKIKFATPVSCHGTSEIQIIKDGIQRVHKALKNLHNKLLKQIGTKSLPADSLIYKIFKTADIIPISDKLLSIAKRRVDLGNPPGKRGSYCDAINWECILENIPNGKDLYFVSEDGDYASVIDPKNLSDFLKDEWARRVSSKIYFYQSLSEFLKDKFTEVKITAKEIAEEKQAIEEASSERVTTPPVSALLRMIEEAKVRSKEMEKFYKDTGTSPLVSIIKEAKAQSEAMKNFYTETSKGPLVKMLEEMKARSKEMEKFYKDVGTSPIANSFKEVKAQSEAMRKSFKGLSSEKK
ncbi:MAG: DUF4935 domain-containing protein [Candidatus Omnitrophica bacterium]|nr:DUF4935 domain-containing protein [Candidatus Omnitrophota bacterium]